MGENGNLAATIFPARPMLDKFAHQKLDADGLGDVEWTIMCFCGLMPPEFWGNYAPL